MKDYKIYKDPLFQDNKTLMGFKGDSYMDTGYIYAPYIPMTQTPVVLDPSVFNPKQGVMTKYGKRILEEATVYDIPKEKKKKYRSMDDDWTPSMEVV